MIVKNRNASETTLRSIMSRPLISAEEKTSVKEAICMMRNKHIRRLLVKKQDGCILRITTLTSTVGNVQVKE
ncbi:MAG TPA: CBS domain-containing protein [Nitrososphaeraceae archaeon]